jgi:hypothetical protein
MPVRKIDRSTVKFCNARRTPAGVEVCVRFEAPKSSGDTGEYEAQFYIDPKTRAVKDARFTLRNRIDGAAVSQRYNSKDNQWKLARELGNMFLRRPAWELLRNREPDIRYIVNEQGDPVGEPVATPNLMDLFQRE